MKWLILFLGCVPCFGVTLSGIVKNQADGRAISNARIVVFHDLALVLVHRGKSDRNGQYYLDLEPGPYRVWVLKEGFHPERIDALITAQEMKEPLQHQMLPMGETPHTTSLRTEIRKQKNKSPLRSLSQPLLSPDLNFQQDNSLVGSVSSQAISDLEGRGGRSSRIEVATQLTDEIRFLSALSSEKREQLPEDAVKIRADLIWQRDGLELGLSGESIQARQHRDPGSSHQFHLSGDYQKRFRTNLDYAVSEDPNTRYQTLSLDQELIYVVADRVPLNQQIRLTDWKENDQTTARHALIRTDWQPAEDRWLGLRSDLEFIETGGGNQDSEKFFVTGSKNWGNLSLDSSLGVHHQEERQDLVQHHQLATRLGPAFLEAEYTEDSKFNVYDSLSVFGSYLPQPLSPYAGESIYQNHLASSRLSLGMGHGSHWTSNLAWVRHREQGSLLQTGRDELYAARAWMRQEAYSYSLASDYWGTRVEIKHSRNAAEPAIFERTGFSYVQSLNPFRNKGLGLLFEFQMTNQPDLPAWWLLEEVPWDLNRNNAWYQGNLSLQF